MGGGVAFFAPDFIPLWLILHVLTEHHEAVIDWLAKSRRYQNACELLREGLSLIVLRDRSMQRSSMPCARRRGSGSAIWMKDSFSSCRAMPWKSSSVIWARKPKQGGARQADNCGCRTPPLGNCPGGRRRSALLDERAFRGMGPLALREFDRGRIAGSRRGSLAGRPHRPRRTRPACPKLHSRDRSRNGSCIIRRTRHFLL